MFRKNPTATDRAFILLALSNAGIKARARRFDRSIRVVFDGDMDTVLATINELGYCNASCQPLTRFNVSDFREVFVYGSIE